MVQIRKFKGPIDSSEGPLDKAHGKLDKAKGSLDAFKGPLDKIQGKIDKAKGPLDKAQGAIGYLLLVASSVMIVALIIFVLSQSGNLGLGQADKSKSTVGGAYSGLLNVADSFPTLEKLEPVTLIPEKAEAYQDKDGSGTMQYDVTSEVSKLDSIFSPNCSSKKKCGNVSTNYYLTSTSGSYFDAIALRFNVSDYKNKNYKGKLRVFLKQGKYSNANWRHYALYFKYSNNSECYDSAPTACKSAKILAKNFNNWLEIPLSDLQWKNGEFSLRLWNMQVDEAELYLEPNE